MEEGQSDVDQNFVKWLDSVTVKFAGLTDVEKITTLDHLIAVLGPVPLQYLHSSVDGIVRRDFLTLLPPELREYLLSFLDFKSLLTACCVSRTWNSIIGSSTRTWQRACLQLGIDIDPNQLNMSAAYLKSYSMKMARRCSDMKTYKAFESKEYGRHLRRITAVYYSQGKLATALDNRTIHFWDCETDSCLFSLRTDANITDIKFDKDSIIVASYLGHLVRWDVKSRERLLDYDRHAGAIFSFDYSRSLDILISGSSDTTLKVWSLSRGNLLTTLHNHAEWVLKVLLHPLPSMDSNNSSDQHILFSMDKSCIIVWKMCYKTLNNNEGLYVSSLYTIPVRGKDVNRFTPGLFFDGQFLFFMKQDSDIACNGVLCKWDVWQQKMATQLNLEVEVKVLLGVGRKYAAVLAVRQKPGAPNFLVYNMANLEPIATWSLPPSQPTTPLYAQVTFGSCDWLNGLNDKNDNGLLLAAGVDYHTVYVLKWKRKT